MIIFRSENLLALRQWGQTRRLQGQTGTKSWRRLDSKAGAKQAQYGTKFQTRASMVVPPKETWRSGLGPSGSARALGCRCTLRGLLQLGSEHKLPKHV